ncbi:HTH-type transcriptional regulator VirS [Acinetobacter stercoris]|uniref:HTH-type transcriptional regulator VirS n=2 Tax=Acinetobacter stercoris TaxID=2126983 RepID=A0A2U3N4P2_9GAMM|nr:HTH-type transcriptional regulator VirS [Acinetobacter stercoris]
MFIEELNQNIIKSISENKPSIQYVSQAMGISVRVLQNKLKLLDTSFVDELSMIRKNLAYKYLQNTNLSISEIAVLLAYKEQPSFNRSFKQWTGVTPLEWRGFVA